jgi:hypothetical protein
MPVLSKGGRIISNNSKTIISIDSDALAFLTAAGITDATQISAIDYLVKELKSKNLWAKMRAIYPLIGGTAFTHKWNLRDPRDLAYVFNLQFLGGITHDAGGIVSDGTTGYARTGFIDAAALQSYEFHMSYYSTTNVNLTQVEMGGRWFNGLSTRDTFLEIRTSGTTYLRLFSENGIIYADANSLGHYVVSRIPEASVAGYKNGISIGTNNTGVEGYANREMYLLALNNAGTPGFYSTKKCAFASIGGGLTDTDALNFYNIVQQYQTILNRQV